MGKKTAMGEGEGAEDGEGATDMGPPAEDKPNLRGTQAIPKVTRFLPHIRQPDRRDRNAKGVFRSFVGR